MKNRWSKDDIKKFYEKGKVRESDRPYVETVLGIRKKVQDSNSKMITRAFGKRSKEKEWIEFNLVYWANAKGYRLRQEFEFAPKRKFAFDWYIEDLRCGIEYNGIMSEKSRHTSITGYSKDMEKINLAQSLGYRVLQFTPLTYKSLLTELNNIK